MRWVCVVLLSVFAAQSAAAQDAIGTDALSEAIRQAAENGMRVIVVDGTGGPAGAAVEPEPAPADDYRPSALMRMQESGATFRATLADRLDTWDSSVNEVAFILRATSPDGRIMTYVEALFYTVLLFLAGRVFTTQVFGKRIARGFVVARIKAAPDGYREKMPFLVFRFFLGIVGTLITMVFAYTVGLAIFGPVENTSLQFTIAALYTAYFAIRVVSDLWRMILSPYLSQYRIPRLSDRAAKRLYVWAVVIATLDITVVIFSTWLHDFGLNYNVYAIVYGALALLVTLGNILMVLFNFSAISNAIRNGRSPEEVSWVNRFLSGAWAPAIIAYFIFGWLELGFDLVLDQPTSVPLIAGAYGVLTSIIVVYGLINYGIERVFERNRLLKQVNETPPEDPGEIEVEAVPPLAPRHSMTNFEQLARRVSGILAFVAGAYALVLVWDSENRLMTGSVIDRALDVIVILFIGYIVYHAFRIWIDSKIAEETGDAVEAELGDEGGGASSASRLATLLPLFRNFILIVVVVSIGLIALLELGINVSPLFAGAGVVGLAVGFGAQSLVRDIFSGAFFLVDDAFRKGEYLDIGSVKGTVEKISVRSFQLRHHLGALHTIPFGEIQVLTNYSRDWVIMKLPLRVTYDTDVEKVRKLIKNLGVALLDDPVIGHTFIQPLKSQGVIEMQDSAMIIRVKFMTKPGDQWLVRKKVYEEIRAMFEREGIKFAHREVTVRLAEEPKAPLTQAQKEAIFAAAESSMDDEMMEGGPAGGDDR